MSRRIDEPNASASTFNVSTGLVGSEDIPDYGIRDAVTGSRLRVSNFGSLATHQPVRLAGGAFDGSALDTNQWTETLGVTGSSSLSGGILTMDPGLLITGRVLEQSIKVGRFLPSHPTWFLGRFALGDTGAANNIRRWGVFDANNGIFFELNGATKRLVTRKAGTDTAITTFDAPANWTLDTNFHNYEMRISIGTIFFLIDNLLLHTASFPTTTWAATPHLRIGLETVNSGVVVGTPTLKCPIVSYARFGEANSRPSFLNITSATTTVLKPGPGNLHHILVNKKGTVSATVTIYDNTAGSGTVIGTIDLTTANPGAAAEYDVDANVGITIVTAGSNIDITAVYE